jgi:hypothetical protein
LLGSALDHVEQSCWAGALADPGEVDDHGDVLGPAARVSPHVLIDTDGGHPVEAVFVVDQHPLAFGEDGDVRCVPGDAEGFGNASDGQVLDDDRFQGHLSPRRDSFALGSAARVVS